MRIGKMAIFVVDICPIPRSHVNKHQIAPLLCAEVGGLRGIAPSRGVDPRPVKDFNKIYCATLTSVNNGVRGESFSSKRTEA